MTSVTLHGRDSLRAAGLPASPNGVSYARGAPGMDEIIEVYSEAELAAVIDRDGSLFAHIENLRVFASHAFADFDAAVKSGSPELIDFYCGWRGCVLNLTRAAASAALKKDRASPSLSG